MTEEKKSWLRIFQNAAFSGFRRIGRSITGRDKDSDSESIDLMNPTQILTYPSSAVHTIKEELFGVLTFVGLIWIVYWLDFFIPFINLNEWFALFPRRLSGLPGVALMTFLHDDVQHLLSNTFPLIVLLTLLAGSRARSWLIVVCIMLVSGLLLWLFGRNGTAVEAKVHVGASLLVFGLVTFLISSAVLEKRMVPMVIAVVVGFLYGTTLLFGILPTSSRVSWDGHLAGAVGGVIVAYWFTQNWLTEEVLDLRKRLETLETPESKN